MRRSSVVAAIVMVVLVGSLAPALAFAADRTIGEKVDDAAIALKVKSKLTADHPANLAKIDVKVQDGIVHLEGDVDSAEHAARAVEIASGVDGVKQVVNNITVKGAGSASPK